MHVPYLEHSRFSVQTEDEGQNTSEAESLNIHSLALASGFKLLRGKMIDLFSSIKFHHI